MRRTCVKLGIAAALGGAWATSASAQVAIPATYVQPVSAADTSKPGFLWNTFHNPANTVNANERTEESLAGLLKDNAGAPLPNLIDPSVVGTAEGEGVKLGTADNALYQFVIPGIINFDQAAGSNGNITPDDQMPGIPGTGGSDEGIAAEALTWLNLPAGEHRLIVNSDDNFRLTIGGAGPSDRLGGVMAGQFNDPGGRGAADTVMTINVETAGLYATRLIWEEGGGGANVEFVQILPDDTRVAVNSPESTIKAYRAVTATVPAHVSLALPLPNSTTAAFDTPVVAAITGAGVTPASVQLTLDGQAVQATVTQNGNVTSVNYTPATRYAPGSQHTVSLAYNDGQARTATWSFTTAPYALLTPDLKVTADTTKPGFIWNVHQNEGFQANDNTRPLQQLAGLLGPNLAEPSIQGAAIAAGTPGATDRLPIKFEIETVINLDQAAGSNGEFTPDEQMPGIPGINGSDEGIAAEILTYIELPAGTNTMIVNSDDGFRTTAGNLRDVFDGAVAGEFSGGRGASDTIFRIVVEEAGIYPFRTVWEEGGGGANIEWKVVKSDGSRVLINDVANGGPKAYRAITTAPLTAVTSVKPTPGSNLNPPDANIEVTIEEGSTTVDTALVKLAVDGTDVAATVTKNGTTVQVSYNPPTEFALGSTHTARLTFTAGTQRVEEWSFSIPARITRDKVAGYSAFLQATGPTWTADAGGYTGQAGDYAMDYGPAGASPSVNVADASFLNTASADDEMSFSFWQKLYNVANMSAFWANSPTSSSSTRGWQAHTPWSDNTVYFDTSGCCDGTTQRISANIDTFPPYQAVGDQSFWTNWHHFVFSKNDATKQIWIDGQLFLEGTSESPLPTDFTTMWIGSESATGNIIHGILDDLAIYNSALTEAQVQALFAKTAPGAVTGNPGLIAHFDFNDPPGGGGTTPTISVARNGANAVITYTGTLQSADTVNGAYTDVAGATSPHSTATSGGAKFFRSKQ